jgi:hypothetical protein
VPPRRRCPGFGACGGGDRGGQLAAGGGQRFDTGADIGDANRSPLLVWPAVLVFFVVEGVAPWQLGAEAGRCGGAARSGGPPRSGGIVRGWSVPTGRAGSARRSAASAMSLWSRRRWWLGIRDRPRCLRCSFRPRAGVVADICADSGRPAGAGLRSASARAPRDGDVVQSQGALGPAPGDQTDWATCPRSSLASCVAWRSGSVACAVADAGLSTPWSRSSTSLMGAGRTLTV